MSENLNQSMLLMLTNNSIYIVMLPLMFTTLQETPEKYINYFKFYLLHKAFRVTSTVTKYSG